MLTYKIILLLCTYVLPGILASVIPSGAQINDVSYVELDAEKEYSTEDIQKLFTEKAMTKREVQSETGTDVQGSLAAVNRVAPPSPNNVLESQLTSIVIISQCPVIGGDNLELQAKSKYNGRNIFFLGEQNIEKLDGATIEDPKGANYASESRVHHAVCRYYKDGNVCNYRYEAVLRASVRFTRNQNIMTLNAYSNYADVPAKRPIVYQNCKLAVPGSKLPCPAITGTRCTVQNVMIYPTHR